MTSREYIDEVKLRLVREEIALNVNDQLIMTYVNKARRQVQGMTLELFPERYGKVLWVPITVNSEDLNQSIAKSYAGEQVQVFQVALPDDLIEIQEVILMWQEQAVVPALGVTYRQQARRLAKQEFWNVQMNAHAVPTIDRPVYTIEQSIAPVKRLLVAGLNWWDETDTNHTVFETSTNFEVTVEIWYTAVIYDIELFDSNELAEVEMTIPPDVDELVIYYAMQYILQNTQKIVSLESLTMETNMLFEMIKLNYNIKQQKESVLLPSKESLQGGSYGQGMAAATQQN